MCRTLVWCSRRAWRYHQWSIKKLILLFLIFVSFPLNSLIVHEETQSSVSIFHLSMTRSEKKYYLRSVVQWCFINLTLCPREISDKHKTRLSQADLVSPQRWEQDWSMECSPSKREAITFTKKMKPVKKEYKFHSQDLTTVQSANTLEYISTANCHGMTTSMSQQRKPHRPWTLSGGIFQLV